MNTLKPYTSLFDKSFSGDKGNLYRLYMQLGMNGLKYCVLDTTSNTFVGIQAYTFKDIFDYHSLASHLNEVLDDSKLFDIDFQSVDVAYSDHRSTLIPNAIFDVDHLREYHTFNFEQDENDHYLSNKLINAPAKNVFAIPGKVTDIFKKLDKVTFRHSSSALLEAALTNSRNTSGEIGIYVHVMSHQFQLTVVEQEQLLLHNIFTYQTSEDFIYYLLFTLDQLDIKNEEASIKITGEVDKDSAIYQMLYKYIRTVNFGSRPKNINYSYILADIPEHHHYELFNQFLCE